MAIQNKSSGNLVMDDSDDEKILCINCKCEINDKPWITLKMNDTMVYGCKYLCAKRLKYYVGTGYWENVVNKEDFPGPRPVQKSNIKKDITANFGIEEIKEEINREEERISKIEEEYYYDSDESDIYF